MDELIREFVAESLDSLDGVDAELVRFEREPGDEALLARARGALHTIKGNCGLLALGDIGRAAHAAETALDEATWSAGAPDMQGALSVLDGLRGMILALAAPAAGERPSHRDTLRVPAERIDRLMGDALELLLVRNHLADIVRETGLSTLRQPLQRLSQVTADLQDSIVRTALQPAESAWRQAPRMLRDIGRELGKSFRMECRGGELEFDRQIVDVLRECLVHLIRNAAVHGIETETMRSAAGKPAQGVIAIDVGRVGSHVVLRFSDDGRGLDGEVARKAATGGGIERAILAPGFTTTPDVTALSGRGVGLSVVQSIVEQHGGDIEVAAVPRGGLTLTLRLPLHAAITPSLIIVAGSQHFAISQKALVEIVRCPEAERNCAEVVSKGRRLPVIDLAGHLALPGPASASPALIMVCEASGRRFGLRVDSVVGTEELVVAPLPSLLSALPWYAGMAIVGSGASILLLDPLGFARVASVPDTREAAPAATVLRDDDRILTFRAGDDAVRAVPLNAVAQVVMADLPEAPARLDAVPVSGRVMPVVPAHPDGLGPARGRRPIVVIEADGRRIGLAVDALGEVTSPAIAARQGTAPPAVLDPAALLAGTADAGGHARRWAVLLVVPDALLREALSAALLEAGLALAGEDDPGQPDAIVLDLDALGEPELEREAARLCAGAGTAARIVGLSATGDAVARRRAAIVGASAIVGTFERKRLTGFLKSATPGGGLAA